MINHRRRSVHGTLFNKIITLIILRTTFHLKMSSNNHYRHQSRTTSKEPLHNKTEGVNGLSEPVANSSTQFMAKLLHLQDPNRILIQPSDLLQARQIAATKVNRHYLVQMIVIYCVSLQNVIIYCYAFLEIGVECFTAANCISYG